MPRIKKETGSVGVLKKTRAKALKTVKKPEKISTKPVKVKVEKNKKSVLAHKTNKETDKKVETAKKLKNESSTEITTSNTSIESPVKSPKIKIKKVRATASVGTINLKGKEAELLKKYQHGKNDTGSTEVQVALFSAKINSLSKHLKKHGKDSDSKRGLLIMVGKRRRLLNYLIKNDLKRYESLIADLGLRK